MSFQVQECSFARSKMNTLPRSFPLHQLVVLLSQLHYVWFAIMKSQNLSRFRDVPENINILPGSGSCCCYRSRDSHTMSGMTSVLPPSKQEQKETNFAAVVQQPTKHKDESQH